VAAAASQVTPVRRVSAETTAPKASLVRMAAKEIEAFLEIKVTKARQVMLVCEARLAAQVQRVAMDPEVRWARRDDPENKAMWEALVPLAQTVLWVLRVSPAPKALKAKKDLGAKLDLPALLVRQESEVPPVMLVRLDRKALLERWELVVKLVTLAFLAAPALLAQWVKTA